MFTQREMRIKATRLLTTAVVAIGVLCCGGTAGAQSEGLAVNTYTPAERGSDWFWADSLNFQPSNRAAVGLTVDWAKEPLVAYDQEGEELAVLSENQLNLHLGGTWIFVERIRVGVNLPILLYQNGESLTLADETIPEPQSAALGDLRLGSDVRLLGKYGEPVTWSAGLQVHLPTGSQAAYTSDGATRLVPRTNVAGEVGSFVYAVQLAYVARFSGSEFVGYPTGNELSYGAALGLKLLDEKLVMGPEIWASTVLSDGSNSTASPGETPVEGIFGAHYRFVPDWRAGLALGAGFNDALGAPQFRLLASLDWAPFAALGRERHSD